MLNYRKGTRTAKVGGKNIDIPEKMKYADYEKVYVKKEMTLDDWEEHSKVAKRVPRTLEEVKPIADKFDKMLDKYSLRPSKWSGNLVASSTAYNCKIPNCDIGITEKDVPDHAVLHELLHARSIAYYPEIYPKYRNIEEASIELLTQEIAKLEKFLSFSMVIKI